MEEILEPYLEKSIQSKDINAINQLMPLISNLTFFQNLLKTFPNLDNLSIIKILTNLTFHEFLEEKIIHQKGDKINGIYIIFTGEILIYDDEQEEQKLSEIKVTEQKGIKKYMFNFIYNINLVPKLIVNPGDAIGLLSNSHDMMISRKNIQATKDTILGYITYNSFYKIIKELRKLDMSVIIPFLKSLNLFANINNFIDKLRLYTTYKKYPKDSYIFEEGDKFKTFYIIKDGSVNISIKIKKTTKSLIQQDLLMGNKNKSKISKVKEYELKGFHTEVYEYSLIRLCKGEIVGDIEYLSKYPSYVYTAKCITPVEIFEVNLKKFIYLADKCGDNLQKFHNKIKNKIEILKKRINNINLAITKIRKDANKRDIFTQSFLDNNNYKSNLSVDKYIINPKSPLGPKIQKFKMFKMNTNLSNIVPNYLNILKEKRRNFSAKAYNKHKKAFNFNIYDKYKNKKQSNYKNKLFEKMHFNKINNFFKKTNNNMKSNSILMNEYTNNNRNPNNIQKLKNSMGNNEMEKINKDLNELSSMDERQKNDFIKVFNDFYKKGRESRDQILFNKKLNQKFLIQNRMNTRKRSIYDNSKSIFRLTSPFRSNSISYNHFY